MYGEGLLVMARTLAANKNVFSESAFLTEWKAAFGVCGTFAGYADHVTRTTIYNMMRVADENEAATMPPKGTAEALRGPLYFGVKNAAATLTGDALTAHAAALVVELGAPEQEAWAITAAAAWDKMLRSPVAADDNQSNTLGKLIPAAVAAAGTADFAARIERAVRVTQANDDAVGYFVPFARAIEAVVLGTVTTPRAALDATLPHFDAERGARVREAIAAADAGEDVWAVLARFGSSCAAASTAPVTAYLLARYGTEGFEPLIRYNMVGDSASRACVLGAILGALGGTPATWLERLDPTLRAETEALAGTVAGFLPT